RASSSRFWVMGCAGWSRVVNPPSSVRMVTVMEVAAWAVRKRRMAHCDGPFLWPEGHSTDFDCHESGARMATRQITRQPLLANHAGLRTSDEQRPRVHRLRPAISTLVRGAGAVRVHSADRLYFSLSKGVLNGNQSHPAPPPAVPARRGPARLRPAAGDVGR